MMTIYWVPRAGYGARGAGQARGKNYPKLGNTLAMASLVQDRSKLQTRVTPQKGGRPIELQAKVREDFTITEKAFSSWLKAPVGYDLFVCVLIVS